MCLVAIFFFVISAVLVDGSERYADSFLENAVPEDVISDLAGRRRLIARDPETDGLSVLWVNQDPHTNLPYVEDPKTKLPYLLKYKVTEDNPQLYRLLRGKDLKPVVADSDVFGLFRPELNKLGEVELKFISEKEAGFTRKEVKSI